MYVIILHHITCRYIVYALDIPDQPITLPSNHGNTRRSMDRDNTKIYTVNAHTCGYLNKQI